MTEQIKTNTGKTDNESKKNSPVRDLTLISLFLLLNAGFFIMLFLGFYDAEHPQHTAVWTIYLVFASYNLIAIVGVLYRRGFGKTLTGALIIFNFVMNLRYPWFPISLILSISAYSLLQKNKTGIFKEKDKLNKYVYLGMAAALFIPVIFFMNPTLVPKLHQDTGEITQEAITKNDPTICNKITNSEKRSECIRSFAETNKDSSICGTIKDSSYERDKCYLHVAAFTKNSSICDLIEGDYDKKMCGWAVQQ